MHNSRKIVVAAVVGGVVAVGVIASNHQVIDRIVRSYGRRKQIIKLHNWYQKYLTEIDEYVGMQIEQYLIEQKGNLLKEAERKGYSTERAVDLKRSVVRDAREMVIADQRRQVTKKYADYLYDIDRKRGLHADKETRDYLLQADALADKLEMQGCSPDALRMTLRINPPN
ncbi:MAG: hypothetical protein JWM07_854 [Candidatus Saccharibacteria bacterium]|nr:hypothetical protein [Candidatus Saccharibacteria bacterium]